MQLIQEINQNPLQRAVQDQKFSKVCHGIAYCHNQTQINFIFHFIQSLNKKDCSIYRLYRDGAIEKNNVLFSSGSAGRKLEAAGCTLESMLRSWTNRIEAGISSLQLSFVAAAVAQWGMGHGTRIDTTTEQWVGGCVDEHNCLAGITR